MFVWFKQQTAYEMLIIDWTSDVSSSDLHRRARRHGRAVAAGNRDLRHPGGQRVRSGGALAPATAGPARHRRLEQGVRVVRPPVLDPRALHDEIGRAYCRESVCQYG